MNLKEARKKAKEYDASLNLVTHQALFENTVCFNHSDGTQCKFANSFVKIEPSDYEDEAWVCIFTEHHGWHVYCSDEFKILNDNYCVFVFNHELQ